MFKLMKLPYDKNALTPYMSEKTVHYHYNEHHMEYVSNLNKFIKDTNYQGKSLDEIVKTSFERDNTVFNNVAQVWNHNLFWQQMDHAGCKIPTKLENLIIENFNSVKEFKNTFIKAGVDIFGSGWVWLIYNGEKLDIMQTVNAVNPLAYGRHALLVVDVWEHSYYLDYRNKRADYLEAFLNHLICWEFVLDRLENFSSTCRSSGNNCTCKHEE